jgi:uncharacterized SAM-binding protein YcdF (DUF218 family)
MKNKAEKNRKSNKKAIKQEAKVNNDQETQGSKFHLKRSLLLIIVTLVSALFTLACFTVYLITSIRWATGTLNYLIGGVAVVVSLLAIITITKQSKRVTALLCVVFTIFTIMCSSFMLAVNVMPVSDLPQGKCVVIILGAHTNGLMPGSSLMTRLNVGSQILKDNPEAVCIVSGGQGENETETEAAAMLHTLKFYGIDPARIYIEDKATDTIENLTFSAEIIENEGFDDLPIIIVTNKFHLGRARILAEKVVGGVYLDNELYTRGLDVHSILYFIYDYTRECMAYIKLGARAILGDITLIS